MLGPIHTRFSRRRLLAGSAGLAGALALRAPLPFAVEPVLAGEPQPSESATGGGLAAASDQLFRGGWFPQADAGYVRILAGAPDDLHALERHAYIAMLSNRLTDAQVLLTSVLNLQPGDTEALPRLADTLYRLDDLAGAAPLFQQFGQDARAAMLASFSGLTPFVISGPDTTQVPFLQTDPLPILEVSINGSEPVPFHLDTGADVVSVNPDLASRVGIPLFGTSEAMFAGGAQAAIQQGRIDSLVIGDIELQNLPAAVAGGGIALRTTSGRVSQGILGTGIFRHFLSTIDYVNGVLILRQPTTDQRQQFELQANTSGTITLPFWMAGDHYMVAHGTVNGYGPILFLIDTGGTTGFVAPDATISAAGIQLDESQARTGTGGGGTFRVVPFTVDELTLGQAVEFDVPGGAGGFPPALESQFGFRIGGTISHDFFRQYALTFDFEGMRLFLA